MKIRKRKASDAERPRPAIEWWDGFRELSISDQFLQLEVGLSIINSVNGEIRDRDLKFIQGQTGMKMAELRTLRRMVIADDEKRRGELRDQRAGLGWVDSSEHEEW